MKTFVRLFSVSSINSFKTKSKELFLTLTLTLGINMLTWRMVRNHYIILKGYKEKEWMWRSWEKEKISKNNLKRGTWNFHSLGFYANYGKSVECLKFFNHISDKISDKRNIAGSLARTWVRTKLCFSLLGTANLCIRGSKTARPQNIVELSSTHVQAAISESRLDVNWGGWWKSRRHIDN